MFAVSRKLIFSTAIGVFSLLAQSAPALAEGEGQTLSSDPCYLAYQQLNGFTNDNNADSTALRPGEIRCGRTRQRSNLSAVPETIAKGTYEQYQRNNGFADVSPVVSKSTVAAGSDTGPQVR
jgi:hypothetical protein